MRPACFRNPLALLLYLAASLIGYQTQAQDWPWWTGPNHNFTTNSGKVLVKNGTLARRIWSSEDTLPVAAGQSPRYGGWGHYMQQPAGGGASPVVVGGRVFMAYFKNRGPEYDTSEYKKRIVNNAWRPNFWYIRADDVFDAYDQVTGKLLWRTVFPDSGMNWADHKAGPSGLTPVVIDNKLFGVGSTGDMWCLDARTGDVRWTSSAIPRRSQLKTTKNTSLRTLKMSFNGNRDISENLSFAGGKLIVSNYLRPTPGWMGIDTSNGTVAWSVPACHAENASPTIFSYNGNEYIAAFTKTGLLTVINPSNGAVLYTQSGMGYNDYTINVWQNYVFLNSGTGYDNGSQLACYQLTDASATLVWQAPSQYGFPSWSVGCIPKHGIVYCRMDKTVGVPRTLLGIEILTGIIKQQVTLSTIYSTESHMFATDSLLFVESNSQHSEQNSGMFQITPDTLRAIGAWTPPHPQHSGYATPISHPVIDGKVYMRGAYHIHCYDFTDPGTQMRVALAPQLRPIHKIVGDSLQLTASLTGGQARQVQLYQDGQLIHTWSAAPYQFTIQNLPEGTHYFSVVATALNGANVMGEGVTVKALRPASMKFWPHWPDQKAEGDTIATFLSRNVRFRYQLFDANGQLIPTASLVAPVITTSAGTMNGMVLRPGRMGGPHLLTATWSHNGLVLQDNSWVSVEMQSQNLTFSPIPTPINVGSKRKLIASATSGKPVQFTVLSGNASIIPGDSLVITGTGPIEVEAVQPGDTAWFASNAIVQRITGKGTQLFSSISLTPTSSTLMDGEVIDFRATALDQDGDELLSQPRFTWLAIGGGTIDSLGMYRADISMGASSTIQVSGTVDGNTLQATATVSITPRRDAISISLGGVAMAGGIVAGVHPFPHWNVASGSLRNLKNNRGVATSCTLTVPSGFNTALSADTGRTGNDLLMKSARTTTTTNVSVFTLSNIPPRMAAGPLDVVVYYQSHQNSMKSVGYTVRGDRKVIKDETDTWSGTFIASTATDNASANLDANYAEWNNLAGSDTLTIRMQRLAGTSPHGISGIQLIGEADTLSLQPQSILLGNISNRLVDDPPFGISTSATSGLPVYITVLSGPARVTGRTTVVLTGQPGVVRLIGHQAGSLTFRAATSVPRSFTVGLPTSTSAPQTSSREWLFPNPASQQVRLSHGLLWQGATPLVRLVSITGTVILLPATLDSDGASADLTGLAPGVYQLTGANSSKRLVVQP